jgi:hypothetical protein
MIKDPINILLVDDQPAKLPLRGDIASPRRKLDQEPGPPTAARKVSPLYDGHQGDELKLQ